MIRVEGLTVSYGQGRALDGLDLHIAPGEFVLLTGPSGCGKSTLIRCLCGLIPQAMPAAMSGRVTVNGRDTREAPLAGLGAAAGVVLQNPSTQLFNLTVDDEVAFAPRNRGLPPIEVARRVDWALEAAGIGPLRGREVRSLSGGEQQRLAIAAVLALEPRVLLLDEPASCLDVSGARQVMATLERLSAGGLTILIAEHRLGELTRLAQRTLVMDEGRIVADGPTPEVLGRRELLSRLGLRHPALEPQGDWGALLEPAPPPPGPPLIELRGIEAGYGRSAVLQGIDLKLYAGELAALVGDNGSGKSTLARVLAGLLRPKRGNILFGGGRRLPPGPGIGLLFQDPQQQLFCDTVEEEVAFGPRHWGSYTPGGLEAVLAVMGLASLRERSVWALSLGEQQRTALAAVLALEPSLAILDEPTVGQDWRRLSAFMDLLAALNRAGRAILVITHDYELVRQYAQRVFLLCGGRIAAEGAPARRRALPEGGQGLPTPASL